MGEYADDSFDRDFHSSFDEPTMVIRRNIGDDCPECETGEFVERTNSKNGNKFLGCSNFPRCKRTV